MSRAMRVRGLNKPIPLFALSLAAFPFIWLAIFYSFVIRAALMLERWPSYNNPDPKRLGFALHHGFLWLGLINMHGVIGAAIVVAIFCKIKWRDFPFFTVFSIGVGSLLVLYSVVKIDPGGFVDWFAD
jgi:hypothetical protein